MNLEELAKEYVDFWQKTLLPSAQELKKPLSQNSLSSPPEPYYQLFSAFSQITGS